MEAWRSTWPASKNDAVRLTIERLSFGGEGVARMEDGRVVFVRGALPGDVVEAELLQEKRSFCRAAATEIIAPSQLRIPAACGLAQSCGGCQLWGLEAGDAWRLKADAAVEAVRRAGRVELPLEVERVAAPSDRRYRRRLRLKFDNSGRTGFFAPGSHTLCQVDDCLVAHPSLMAAAAELNPTLAGLGEGRLLLELDRDETSVVALLETRRQRHAARGLTALFEAPTPPHHLRGVRLPSRSGPRDFGAVTFEQQVGQWPRKLTVGAFTQANDAVNEFLVDIVTGALEPSAGDRLLELYCGAGNFSLSLADQGMEVCGVEIDAGAVDAARAARAALGAEASARLRFEVRDLNRGLPAHLAEPGRFDKVLLDPPRSGARAAIKGLLALRAATIVYVSCDPPTLGRDLGSLVSGGYKLTRLVALDMFPRTYHTEMVAVLSGGEG